MDATGMWQMRDKQQPAQHAPSLGEAAKGSARPSWSSREASRLVSLRGCVVEDRDVNNVKSDGRECALEECISPFYLPPSRPRSLRCSGTRHIKLPSHWNAANLLYLAMISNLNIVSMFVRQDVLSS